MGKEEQAMSYAVDVLVRHVLLTTRWGLAACAAENCVWEDKFHPAKDIHSPLIPSYILVAHAEHQLELLEVSGFEDARQSKAALRMINSEVELIEHGGLANYGEGVTFYSPIYPMPRGVKRVREILDRVL
jgi:hypothetical protein